MLAISDNVLYHIAFSFVTFFSKTAKRGVFSKSLHVESKTLIYVHKNAMLTHEPKPQLDALLGPLTDAALALGRLQQALQHTPLHRAWLWREMARTACKVAQNAGYRVKAEQLMLELAGVSQPLDEEGSGPAAAKRVFLVAGPLFRKGKSADSLRVSAELFEPLWADHRSDGRDEPPQADSKALTVDEPPADRAGQGQEPYAAEEPPDAKRLQDLVATLVRSTRVAGETPLLVLLQAFRVTRARGLSPMLMRLALPLALHQAGLVPKIVPGLLGGRPPLPAFGPLPTGSPVPASEPPTRWLARALAALAKEANAAGERLNDLTQQHRAWHQQIRGRYHRDSRAPAVLDLLAATPVLSASLVARHLGCRPQSAARILGDLAGQGILHLATGRRRWKIYLASDLVMADRDSLGAAAPLSLSEALPAVDRDAIEATLDGLFADLERLDQRTKATLAGNGAV